MKYILSILVTAALLIFPQRVYCTDILKNGVNSDYLKISFVEYDYLYGNHWFSEKYIEIGPHRHLFAKVETALGALFSLDLPNGFPYPEGIQIVDIYYIHGHLTVAFSEEFAGFGGGSMLERIYLGQILKTLLNIDGVEKVSIKADTPEGIRIKERCSWYELMDGIVPLPPYRVARRFRPQVGTHPLPLA